MKKRQQWMKGKAVDYCKAGSYNSMAGNRNDRKIILHNEGVDRGGAGNPMDLARYVRDRGIEYHLIWNARAGTFVQIVPFGSAAKSLLNGGIDGGIGCNRSGAVCIQICVQGYGSKPFTDGPMKGAGRLLDIAEAWGVPLRKIGGKDDPASFARPSRSLSQWHTNGFGGHSMAPRNDHHDPAAISWSALKKAMKAG